MRLALPAVLATLGLGLLPGCSTEPIQADPAPAPVSTARPSAAGDFDRTGELRCSVGGPKLDRACPFGLSVAGGGTAVLHVVNPTSDVEGIQRVLLYQAGTWTTLDGATVETSAAADGGTLIAVDGREFYALPRR